MAEHDFALTKLTELYRALLECGYQFVRFDRYWQDRETWDDRERVVLFRHDVDRFPETALQTARTEARLGIGGTYFFRVKPHVFQPAIVRAIAELGHEIGYHYEDLADARGNVETARGRAQHNLACLRRVVPVVSASMHSRPLSRWDNRRLWDHVPLKELGIQGETYRTVDHHHYLYLADSGRSWNANRNVIWDTVQGRRPPVMHQGTDGLIQCIRRDELGSLQLLIHPNRWPAHRAGWVLQTLADQGINLGKTVIKPLHRKRCSAT